MANVIIQEKCDGCGDCYYECPVRAIKNMDEVFSIEENFCTGCGVCLSVCPCDAIATKE